MKPALIFSAKAVALWVAISVAQILGGLVMLTFSAPPPEANDGPLTAAQAVPLVNAIQAIVLAIIASRLRGKALVRLGMLFIIFYGVVSAQTLI